MTGEYSDATILLVDDEESYLEAYAAWLEDAYTVRVASSGAEALAKLDDAVEAVLLDRRMPDLSGDEVLDRIRTRELRCQVAMVTAVEPELDIIEMPFDDYVVKPVSKDELRSVVANLCRLSTLDERLQESYSLASKKSALEANVVDPTLESSDEYRSLTRRLDEIEAQLDEVIEDLMDDGGILSVYNNIES